MARRGTYDPVSEADRSRQIADGRRAAEERRVYGQAQSDGRIHRMPCLNPNCHWHFGMSINHGLVSYVESDDE